MIRYTGEPKRRPRPRLMSVRRWSEVLRVSLMQMRFVLATHDEFAALKSKEYLTESEARRVAEVARTCP